MLPFVLIKIMVINPHYIDDKYPAEINLPLYFCDEYQTYDICYIHGISYYIPASVTYIWNWFYDQLLTSLPFRNRFNNYYPTDTFCLIDRYVPNDYEYAEDYGKKVFDLYKVWSGSYVYNNYWLSGYFNSDSYGHLRSYDYVIPYPDYMRVFNPYNLQFTLPIGSGKCIITYYHAAFSDNANFCINKAFKVFYLKNVEQDVKIECDYEIQICSVVVNCQDVDVKVEIESRLDTISALILYKNLDTLLANLQVFLNSAFVNTWKVWITGSQNVRIVYNLYNNSDCIRYSDGYFDNVYTDLPSNLKFELQNWFYIYPKVNPWGTNKVGDDIKGNLYWFDEYYRYEDIDSSWQYDWQLQERSGIDDIYRIGFSMIPRNNYPTAYRNFYNAYVNELYADLILHQHDYGLGYKIALNTLTFNCLPNISADSIEDANMPIPFSSLLAQVPDTPSSYNGLPGSYTSIEFRNRTFHGTSIARNNQLSETNFWYDYVFKIFGEEDGLFVIHKNNFYYSGIGDNKTPEWFYSNWKLWSRTCTVDDTGYVTETYNIKASGTKIMPYNEFRAEADANNGVVNLGNYTHTSSRIFNSSIADREALLADQTTIHYYTDNQVIEQIKNKLHFTNEFLLTGENGVPDSIRVKEAHAWSEDIHSWIKNLFNPEKHGLDKEGDPASFTMGDQIDLIAKALGISFDRKSGDIISIRQSKHIPQGGIIPAGWYLGQFGVNQGGNTQGQTGGNSSEDRLGIAYELRSNYFSEDPYTGEKIQINQGGYILCENIPQLLHIILDDLDRCLGLEYASAGVVPSAHDGSYMTFSGLSDLLAEIAYMQSGLSASTVQAHVAALINQAILQEILGAFGLPVDLKTFSLRLPEGNEIRPLYPGLADDAPTLFNLYTLLMSNLALTIGKDFALAAPEE